ncbi:hypothetical protein MTR67_024537 [Solanum verrucosum]|uniref:Uncharacterized protein n=1 Tax=Solanum verrucosum TaxID=315347 RepID=A0AAF0QVI5_SOLVR|nr:hypothetical protein MTR67_024537 [Solanum verrucosum]
MAVALFVQDIKNKFLDLIKFLISFGKGNDEHENLNIENEKGMNEEEKGAFVRPAVARRSTPPGKRKPPRFQTGNNIS